MCNAASLMKMKTARKMKDRKSCMWMKFRVQWSFLRKDNIPKCVYINDRFSRFIKKKHIHTYKAVPEHTQQHKCNGEGDHWDAVSQWVHDLYPHEVLMWHQHLHTHTWLSMSKITGFYRDLSVYGFIQNSIFYVLLHHLISMQQL